MPRETFVWESYCPFCKKDTEIEVYCDGHERDSSNDRETCLTCGAYKLGFMTDWVQGDKNDGEASLPDAGS